LPDTIGRFEILVEAEVLAGPAITESPLATVVIYRTEMFSRAATGGPLIDRSGNAGSRPIGCFPGLCRLVEQ